MTFERDNIKAMEGYTSGEQPDEPGTIKLNTNENPYPPSPRAMGCRTRLIPPWPRNS